MNNPNGPSSSSNNWRNPSASHKLKYNLQTLPEDFEPTVEEQQLLDMYEVIRNHERVAARLKEEAARAKLAAKDAEFQQKLAPKKNKRNRKPKAKLTSDDNNDDDDLDDDDDSEDLEDDDDDEDDEDTLHDRREAKLAELRVQVEEAKQNAMAAAPEAVDDLLREQLLGVTETSVDDIGPMLKRKRKDLVEQSTAASSSLIANLTAAVTPPHDFSAKLELTATRGKVLFPVAGALDQFKWTPREGVNLR